MLSWEGINEFVAVAEAESFTLAAKRLKISTAQVSRQISALEERLSMKLFYRTTRKVSVTDAGQVYYQHCRQVLDGLKEAELAITNMQSTPTGRLKITAPVTYGEDSVAPLLNNFIAKYPLLDVQLHLSNQLVNLTEDGFDLAIRLGVLNDSSMMAKRLSSRTHFVCASPAYIAKFGEPCSLSELRHHNCLQGTFDYWRFQEKGKLIKVKVKGNISCNSGRVLLDAALKGLGIVQLPDYYVLPYIENKQLVSLMEPLREPSEGVWALYPHNRQLSPKIRLLIDYLADALG